MNRDIGHWWWVMGEQEGTDVRLGNRKCGVGMKYQ